MSLSIANNTASLNAQHNLHLSNMALSKSLERLSSGFKVNRGADGPAALVISEQQRAQIAGLRAAIDNTSKGVAMVQTGEGAMNEISKLLLKMRSLALDSANTAVHDANSLAANQAEVQNAIDTIESIATRTQFGTKVLLDGTANAEDFQIGPNANQTFTVDFGDMTTGTLGIDTIDVSVDAQAAIADIDAAINLVTTKRGELGAIQANTLEATAANLAVTLENTIAAESVIRDTDFAQEVASFTKFQVLVQAGATVLANANQTSQVVLGLLRS